MENYIYKIKMTDWGPNIKAAARAFCEQVRVQLKLFEEFVPGNSAPLKGDFVEALVKQFIAQWIHPCQYLTGTFYSPLITENIKEFGLKNPVQFDGIIYNPEYGPAIQRVGDFIVVHPDFCPAIIEVKKSFNWADLNRQIARQQQFLTGYPFIQNHFIISIKKDKKLDQWGLVKYIPRGFSLFDDNYNADEEMVICLIDQIYCVIQRAQRAPEALPDKYYLKLCKERIGEIRTKTDKTPTDKETTA